MDKNISDVLNKKSMEEIIGKEVEVEGWVHETRDHGGIRFLILRDSTGVIQITGKKKDTSKELFENLKLPKESVIKVKGVLKEEKQAPRGIELIPNRIEVLNEVSILLPVDPTERVVSELDVRLDNRHIDLRRKKVSSIFKIQAEILKAARKEFEREGFQEILPTSIVAAAAEGGTELFPIVYFDKEAFLAQSPQLYKQLAVIGGIKKAFMIVPYFRAEKHKTTAHLNQSWAIDAEIGFIDHHGAMEILERVFLGILKSIKKNCKEELKELNINLNVPKKIGKYTYTQAVEMLNEAGHEFEWGSEIGRDEERKIQELTKEDAYFMTDYPTKIRPFYTMPNKDNPKLCNAFDLMYMGLEMVSGAQRIHKADLLTEMIKSKGMNPSNFEFYINAFKSGAPPHAGWAIGVERLTMAITRQPNVRECSLFPRDIDRITP